jgi:NADH-quinone oxidoreductase subunit H
MLGYGVYLGLSVMGVVMLAGSFHLRVIVEAQGSLWFCIPQFLGLVIFLVAGIAEAHRLPFDLPEAESELTAGFHTEYSGIAFGLFMIAEYTYMFVNCCLVTTLFLGGWKGIPLPFGEYSSCIWFFIKVYGLMFIIVWARWTYPRVRFDQLMNFSWKYLIPLSLVNLLITAILVKLL